jgi:hypothetical protein
MITIHRWKNSRLLAQPEIADYPIRGLLEHLNSLDRISEWPSSSPPGTIFFLCFVVLRSACRSSIELADIFPRLLRKASIVVKTFPILASRQENRI